MTLVTEIKNVNKAINKVMEELKIKDGYKFKWSDGREGQSPEPLTVNKIRDAVVRSIFKEEEFHKYRDKLIDLYYVYTNTDDRSISDDEKIEYFTSAIIYSIVCIVEDTRELPQVAECNHRYAETVTTRLQKFKDDLNSILNKAYTAGVLYKA